MQIGEPAREAGTTTKAVRFYESAGLLPTPPRRPNGYRSYAPADMERLRLLVGLRSLDLSLDRAGELAVLCAAGHCEQVSTELRDLITRQRAEIQRRVDELAHLDERLATLEQHLAAGDPPQSVIPRGRSVEMATCDCSCGQCCGCDACGCGCACSSHRRAVARETAVHRAMAEPPGPRVELLWFQECPNHPADMALLDELLSELAPGATVDDIDATDPAVAQRHRFPGSPTIRIDGRDVDPSFHDPGDYTPRCRLYRTSAGLGGLPERAWIEAAIIAAVSPRAPASPDRTPSE